MVDVPGFIPLLMLVCLRKTEENQVPFLDAEPPMCWTNPKQVVFI